MNKNILKLAVVVSMAAGSVMAQQNSLSSQADIERCNSIALHVANHIKSDPDRVLAHVRRHVAENEDCAGEITQAAIQASGAEGNNVIAIIDAAVAGAPGQADVIVKAAVPVAGNEISLIEAAAAKYGVELNIDENPLDPAGSAPGNGPSTDVANSEIDPLQEHQVPSIVPGDATVEAN
ncbi:MAG: hypothetical protein ACSHX0_08910 [Akkermansiaceae bacterium]